MASAILILAVFCLMNTHIRYVELSGPQIALDEEGLLVGDGLSPARAFIYALAFLIPVDAVKPQPPRRPPKIPAEPDRPHKYTHGAISQDDWKALDEWAAPAAEYIRAQRARDRIADEVDMKNDWKAIDERLALSRRRVEEENGSRTTAVAERPSAQISRGKAWRRQPEESWAITASRWATIFNFPSQYLARRRLAQAEGLAGNSGFFKIHAMAPKAASHALDYDFYDVNPSREYIDKFYAMTPKNWPEDKKHLWIRANYQTGVAVQFAEELQERGEALTTRMVIGAIEGVPYLMGMGPGLLSLLWLARRRRDERRQIRRENGTSPNRVPS